MSSIGSVLGISAGIHGLASMRGRPDPAQLAEKLFSRLDTRSQGYIEVADLQSAFDRVAQGGKTPGNAGEVFARFDSSGDGKLTSDEFGAGVAKLAEQLASQLHGSRIGRGHGGDGDAAGGAAGGVTKEQLSSQLDRIGSSDSPRATLLSNFVDNFIAADSDGNGKLSFREAKAYAASNAIAGSAASAADQANAGQRSEARLMHTIMQLMHAFGGGDAKSSALSLSA